MAKEFWDKRYEKETYVYGTNPNQYFRKIIDTLDPGKLLLPGEGEGRNAVYAARKGWEVTAIDQSEKGKIKAESLAAEYDVSINYFMGDILDFPFNRSEFDAIALIFFHLPPETRMHVHKQFIHSMKPGGYLIMEAFAREQLGRKSGGPPAIELLYDTFMMNRDFQTLDIIELYQTEENLDEGPYHQGKAAIIRMLAKN